jgi:predicted Rossmann fold nucleotide-binding protein DprA/Smf involved in DNA uptake
MDPGEIYAVDDLIERSGLGGRAVLLRLTDLELAGRVARAGAGRFVRSRQGMLT